MLIVPSSPSTSSTSSRWSGDALSASISSAMLCSESPFVSDMDATLRPEDPLYRAAAQWPHPDAERVAGRCDKNRCGNETPRQAIIAAQGACFEGTGHEEDCNCGGDGR